MSRNIGYGIVDRTTERLVVLDSRVPIYWLKYVAIRMAHKQGYETAGPDPDVRIIKIDLNQITRAT